MKNIKLIKDLYKKVTNILNFDFIFVLYVFKISL